MFISEIWKVYFRHGKMTASHLQWEEFFPIQTWNQKWDKQRDRWAITGDTMETVRTLTWLKSDERWDKNCIWESECDKRVSVPEKIWFYLVDRGGQCRQLLTIALMLCWCIFATYFEGRRIGWGESVKRLLQQSRKKGNEVLKQGGRSEGAKNKFRY